MDREINHAVIMGVALIAISAFIVSAFSIYSCAKRVMQVLETGQTVEKQVIVAEQTEEKDAVVNENNNNTIFGILLSCFNAILTVVNLWIYRKENKDFHRSCIEIASRIYKLHNHLYHDDVEYQ